MASKTNLKKFAKVSTEVLSILDHQLATITDGEESPHAQHRTPMQDQILFYKMKADAHRYLAELAPRNHRDRVSCRFPAESTVEADCALSAYKIASGMAHEHLEACHPLRLMLAYNFSTFYADVRHSIRMANHIAKTAYESACEIVHVLSGTQYKDAIHVLQLIRDNISNWGLQLATGEAYDDDEESDVDVDEDFSSGDEERDDEHLENMAGKARTTLNVSSPSSHRRPSSAHMKQINSPPGGVGAKGSKGSIGSPIGSPVGSPIGSPVGSRRNSRHRNTADMHGTMAPSASAPVLKGVTGGVKGHGGRALRPDSAVSDSRPDSAPRIRSSSRTRTPSPNHSRNPSNAASPSGSLAGSPRSIRSTRSKKRRRSLSILEEGPVPVDHLISLLRGAENISMLELEEVDGGEEAVKSEGGGSSGGGSSGGAGSSRRLGQVLFELFHSYLEGDVGTPVATHLSDGTTKTLEDAILQVSRGKGRSSMFLCRR